MNIIQNIRCKFDSHQWSDWKLISPGNPDTAFCKELRICENCQQSQRRFAQKHVWQEWEYSEDGSCKRVRYCQNCQAKETGKVKHNWGKWAYTAQDSCEQRRFCNQCDKAAFRNARHDWGEWLSTDDPSQEVRFCKRCKTEEHREKPSYKVSCTADIIEPRKQDSFIPMDIKIEFVPEGLSVSFIEDPSKLDRFTYAAIKGMYHWVNSSNNNRPFVMPFKQIEAIQADFYKTKGNVTEYVSSKKGRLKTVPAGRKLHLRMLYRNQVRGTKLKLNMDVLDRFGLHSDEQALNFYNEVLDKLS